jgi:hypothetical protein
MASCFFDETGLAVLLLRRRVPLLLLLLGLNPVRGNDEAHDLGVISRAIRSASLLMCGYFLLQLVTRPPVDLLMIFEVWEVCCFVDELFRRDSRTTYYS